MNSIIQETKRCWVCGKRTGLERHHVLGGPNRKHSEEHGLTVWLCREHHTGPAGAHNNRELSLMLRETAQLAFERNHTREEWMQIFGRNYLPEWRQ